MGTPKLAVNNFGEPLGRATRDHTEVAPAGGNYSKSAVVDVDPRGSVAVMVAVGAVVCLAALAVVIQETGHAGDFGGDLSTKGAGDAAQRKPSIHLAPVWSQTCRQHFIQADQ